MTLKKLTTALAVAATAVLIAAGAGTLALQPSAAGQPQPAARGGAPSAMPGLPPGWFGGSAKFDQYEVGRDHAVAHGGKTSAYVVMREVGDTDFGTLGQTFRADDYRGKRVRLSAYVKTEDARGGAGLWMRVDSADKTVAFDNMQKRMLKGTQDWKRLEIVLDVPPAAVDVTFGLLVSGRGRAWVDDFAFEVVDAAVKSTNLLEGDVPIQRPAGAPAPPAKPTDLDFEAEGR